MKWGCTVLLVAMWTTSAVGQTPRPFPTPARPATALPAPEPKPVEPQPEPQPGAASDTPTEATLGIPVYPGAQFLTSYDAGLGQRYYLFGVQTSFAETVAYYRTILKQRGEQVFEEPPTHVFEIGRFREDVMAFPPGVTLKDFTTGGSEGYLNPKRGASPKSFPTIIQIVPAPPGTAR
jgi:hypothetical protein